MVSLGHEMTVRVKLDEKTLEEAKQALLSIQDEVLRAHIRRVLAEEKDALYKEFQERIAREARLQAGLPTWTQMETK